MASGSAYLNDARKCIKDFEGSVPWMYLDTRGNVTVGVGFMLPDVAAATALLFAVRGRTASAHEIAADFNRVRAMKPYLLANAYRCSDSPVLHPEIVDEMLMSRLELLDKRLAATVSRFIGLQDCVRLALVDMAFNLGIAGLAGKYPRLIEAIEAGDYMRASEQCVRRGISDQRNQWTVGCFRAACVKGGVM